MSPFLMMAIMSSLIPPISEGIEKGRGQQKAAAEEHLDVLDQELGVLLKNEVDPKKKECIRIMQKVHTVGNGIHDLRYFADWDANTVHDKDRKDALGLLEHISDHLSEFWDAHKKPEGTMWDKE